MRMLLVVLFLAGCFPYRATFRSAIDGIIVDAQGKALSAVRVEACSGTHWDRTCRFHVSTTTDDQGHFHLTRQRAWDWCCIGEPLLPYVVIAGCAKNGVASAMINPPHAHDDVRLVITPVPPIVGGVVHPDHRNDDTARAFATRVCGP